VEEVARITGSTVDFAFDCTGVIAVIETIAQTVGMLGTLVLIGGAPAGASFSLDHLSTLWGKRVIGVLGGGGRSGQLIPALVELHQQGRFPFDRLVKYYDMSTTSPQAPLFPRASTFYFPARARPDPSLERTHH